MDISTYILPKSDQLSADALVAGPIQVQIKSVSKGSQEQPVNIEISDGLPTWRPSKTALRCLVAAWGTTNSSEWVGRWVELYRDSDVKWAGKKVGGVRISALSHIDAPLSLSLTETRGKKRMHNIRVLTPPQLPTLDEVLQDAGVTVADCDAWRKANGKGLVADLDQKQRQGLADWLAADSGRVDAIRALVPNE